MDNLEKQIQDFWENRTSPEQRREILRQLAESGMEWKEFLQQYYNKVLSGEEPSSLDKEQKSRVWQRLKEQHLDTASAGIAGVDEPHATTRTVQLRRLLPWLAAASVLLIVGVFIYPEHKKPSAPAPIAATPVTQPTIVETKNTTAGEQTLTLPDHSEVQLAPGTTIRYKQNFETSARNIQLEGRALFEVAKDSARPFTVTARGFATTALATRFIVDATRPVVSIRLLKGKIVVNATTDAAVAIERTYLTPGETLKINTTTKKVDHLTLSNPQPNTPGDLAAGKLSFERTSLATVFQRLSEYYKTPILSDKAEIHGLSFTGDFKPSDDLDLALKVICNMNQLSFTKEKGTIVIRKQQ